MCFFFFFFFKQKTAYEMRISDWSSDVCSSDLFASRRLRKFKLYIPSERYDEKALAKLGDPKIGRVNDLGRYLIADAFQLLLKVLNNAPPLARQVRRRLKSLDVFDQDRTRL